MLLKAINLDTFSIPNDLHEGTPGNDTGISLHRYDSITPSFKNRVSLHQHLFSFVLEGHKEVIYPEERIVIDNTQFLMLAAGNCLMSEKTTSENGHYRSLLLFFDAASLSNFFARHPGLLTDQVDQQEKSPVFMFGKDKFLKNFTEGLELMAEGNFPKSMLALKFEELMLYLCSNYPHRFYRFNSVTQLSLEDQAFKKTVEKNIESNVTVEELAFLCNTSISTFKRHFTRLYGSSPNKWMLGKRLELAALLLKQQEKPSDVYYKVGYENLSSFIQSFKQAYGLTPKEYQLEKMNLYP